LIADAGRGGRESSRACGILRSRHRCWRATTAFGAGTREANAGTDGALCPQMSSIRCFAWACVAAIALLLASGVARAQQPTLKPIATVRQLMQAMIVPFSDAVFDAAFEPPKTDAQWTAVRATALALAESGNLLMIGRRARDEGEWMRMARDEVDAAEAVIKAIDAKNATALAAAGDVLYETCDTCHARYMHAQEPALK